MLVTSYSEDVEADLARYYPREQDQLAAFFRGDMTIRRLHVLVTRLPRDSHTFAVRAGGRERAAWTQDSELLAGVIEAVKRLELTFVRANTDSKKQHNLPKDIDRIPRPWDGDETTPE